MLVEELVIMAILYLKELTNYGKHMFLLIIYFISTARKFLIE
jgi:hypothetical protein